MSAYHFSFLGPEHMDLILPFAQQLNPNIPKDKLILLQNEMFSYTNYRCFALWEGEQLRGISSAWTSTRFYSGKQLEVDNYVVDSNQRSKGLGRLLLEHISAWAQENNYRTIELNSYVDNPRSHKFYMNQGFKILGFHFLKKI